MRRLVEVAQQDLLIVQRERLHGCARLEHRLRGFERVAVLQRVLLEGHHRELLREALSGILRRCEVARALEDVCVVRRRPVVVRDDPVRFPDEHHEVGEEQKRVEAPRLVPRRVQRGRQLA